MSVLLYALPVLAAVLLAAAGMIYSERKIIAIWMFFAGGVLSLLSVCLFWQNSVKEKVANPAYRVGIEASVLGTTRDSAWFGAAINGNLLCPVPMFLYLRIANLQSSQTEINQVTIEAQLTKDKWFIIPSRWIKSVPIPDYAILVIPHQSPQLSPRLTLIGDPLRERLAKPLQPNETIHGWILLDWPKEYDNGVRPIVLRITIQDSAGKKVVSVINTATSGGTNVGPNEGLHIQGSLDLTGYQSRHYADPVP